MLPACACPSVGNRTCALCVYTIVDRSGETMEGCKCPTCRVQWTAMRLPSCGGVQGDLVQLEHASLVQQPVIVNAAPAVAVPVSGNVPAPVALPMAMPMSVQLTQPARPATVLIEDDGGMDDVLAELDDQRADANDPSYVPSGRRVADDSDEEFDSDDDSVVGDDAGVVDTRLAAASSPPVRPRVGGPKKSIMKKSSGARKDQIIRTSQPTVQAAVSTAVSTVVAAAPASSGTKKRPSNGKPVSRCMGSEPRKVPFLDDWSKNKINDLLTKYPDLGDDDETDSAAIAADCKVLMMKALYFHGKNSDGAAAKYPRAIKELMDGPRGFALRGELTEAAASRARSIATKLATAAQATNKQSVERLTNNYMDAYAMYMKVRKLAVDGELNYDSL